MLSAFGPRTIQKPLGQIGGRWASRCLSSLEPEKEAWNLAQQDKLEQRDTPSVGSAVTVLGQGGNSFQPRSMLPMARSMKITGQNWMGSYRALSTMSSLPYKRMQAKKNRRMVSPSQDVASGMPLTTRELDNQALATLAALEDHPACCEMLVRHIMSTDSVSYVEAMKTFKEIQDYNNEGNFLRTLPYKLGIGVALFAGFASFPLCFHLPSVGWFNEYFVTADVPEPKDLETWLEVGSWSWNWMEPPLGQISFFLLCLQYSQEQMDNLGIKPYRRHIKESRAERLVANYPQYDAHILAEFSKTSSLNSGD